MSLAIMIHYLPLLQRLQGQIDSKLQAKINEKKQALGLRTERTQTPSYQTQDEYDMSI